MMGWPSFPRTEAELAAQGYFFINSGKCKDPDCAAEIWWYRTPARKHIPLDARTLEPHWPTCKASAKFGRAKT